MASKKKPDGYPVRPGEGAPQKARKKASGRASRMSKQAPAPKPGSRLPKGYSGPAGASQGGRPKVGDPMTEGGSLRDRYGDIGGSSKGMSRQGAATPQKPAAQPSTPSNPNAPGQTPPSGPDPARLALARWLKLSGLPESMVDAMYAARNAGLITDQSSVEDYLFVAADVPEFAARYPSIVNQVKRMQAGEMGVQLMTPGQVLEYEKALKNTADDYGLSSWVTSPAQIAKLIDNGVDAEEAIDRIHQAGYAATVAPKEFREAFFKKYGLTEGNLVGFFLDPDKEEAEIKKAVVQGEIVAAAMQNGFANNWSTGERLADRGVSPDQAMSGFARAALTRGLGSGVGQIVDENTMIDAEFGDAAATQKVASVTAQRVGRFSGAGGAVESQTGVTGLAAARTT